MIMDGLDDVCAIVFVGPLASTARLAFSHELVLEANLSGAVHRHRVRTIHSPGILEVGYGADPRVLPALDQGLVFARVDHLLGARAIASRSRGGTSATTSSDALRPRGRSPNLRDLGLENFQPAIWDTRQGVEGLHAEVLNALVKVWKGDISADWGVPGCAQVDAYSSLEEEEDPNGDEESSFRRGVEDTFQLEEHGRDLGGSSLSSNTKVVGVAKVDAKDA